MCYALAVGVSSAVSVLVYTLYYYFFFNYTATTEIYPLSLHDALPISPTFLSGGFNRSLTNLFRSDAPNYSIGATISFPFRNRTAKANLAGARIQQDQLAAQTRAQEEVVVFDVRNAVQAVESTRQRVVATRTARENAEIQLEGERKLYDAGRSTTFLLFQRENA